MGERIAQKPITIPQGVVVQVEDFRVSVKGKKGEQAIPISPHVAVVSEEGVLKVSLKGTHPKAKAIAGTTRSILQNMVQGVTEGFSKKLELVGIGYRAQAKNTILDLSVGYSHPIQVKGEKGITFETPSQTEIFVKGPDKQLVGQTAAMIRHFRPPEPYKGKGIRYAGEVIRMKETKKK
ncbi:MAG: 50S ribosomal protein L6 [Gammaproteobacteria bacterium]|nr:50S ribosomal protein L6 [Gammaproteobacteria bacterium]